jgi:hypothetical protein
VKQTAKTKALDILFSEYIRKRAIKFVGGCERCLTQKYGREGAKGYILPAWKQLQCSHFIGRGSWSTRFDEDNGAGLCGGCHLYLEHHPLEHKEFFEKRLGDKLDLLICRGRTPVKHLDISALTLYYKTKIKELEG